MRGWGEPASRTAVRDRRPRLAVLEMQLRQLKSQLKKRGIKCDKCSQREHYMDLMLDNAHMPHA